MIKHLKEEVVWVYVSGELEVHDGRTEAWRLELEGENCSQEAERASPNWNSPSFHSSDTAPQRPPKPPPSRVTSEGPSIQMPETVGTSPNYHNMEAMLLLGALGF